MGLKDEYRDWKKSFVEGDPLAVVLPLIGCSLFVIFWTLVCVMIALTRWAFF